LKAGDFLLDNFEKRVFNEGEKVWIGRYKNLRNILHWHFECEIITILEGSAKINIDNQLFEGIKGDSFFCNANQMHYIYGNDDSIIEIVIIDTSIANNINSKYLLANCKLSNTKIVRNYIKLINNELMLKGDFYKIKIESIITQMIIDLFRGGEVIENEEKNISPTPVFYKSLIDKIYREYSHITFSEAAEFSGYSSAYFSKMFKRLSGMTFSTFLNYVKVQNAIFLLNNRQNKYSITEISNMCGFTTIRNFNRVFKQITKFSPLSLPKDYTLNKELKSADNQSFNPTLQSSELI